MLLRYAALRFEPTIENTDCRDPRDNTYLALAMVSSAVAIVTGDEDLLVLDPWRGIRILGPSAFITPAATSAAPAA